MNTERKIRKSLTKGDVLLIIGIIVGYISLRIEGIYLAIVTLGVAQIIKEVLSALMDTIKIKGSQLVLFGNEDLKLKTDTCFYILIAVMFVLMLITSNLMNSPTGRAMLAMKNSTSAAQAFGISLLKYRLLAFIISIVPAACKLVISTSRRDRTFIAFLTVLGMSCSFRSRKILWPRALISRTMLGPSA